MNLTPPSGVANVLSQGIQQKTVIDIATQLCAMTRADLVQRQKMISLKEIADRARDVKTPARGFSLALQQKTADRQIGLIAEIKKASPITGVIRTNYDPVSICRAYEKAGATCLSVLTEPHGFCGSIEDLKAVKDASSLPILRKDLIIDPWQVYESRIIGADCILLIMAILSDQMAVDIAELAYGLGIDVLVEVHNETELKRALTLNTALIGINNRNLKTFEINLAVTEHLAPLVPPDRIIIAENGIKTHADIMRLNRVGASGFLVGEILLRQPDSARAVRILLGEEEDES